MTVRTCEACGREKSLDDFYRYRRHSGGYYKVCKSCHKSRTRKWHTDNPGSRRESNWRSRGIKGMTERCFKEMLRTQDGVCAICRQPERVVGRKLAVDHDHRTGRVRGLLCLSCNQAIGKIENGTLPLFQLVQYLS